MNEQQKKAAGSVRRALSKARDAGLQLSVGSGSVFVHPLDVDPHRNGSGDFFDILESEGEFVNPVGFVADGGAGN